MQSDDSAPVYMLDFQRGFQCRHSGACCTSGWHIPVEPHIHDTLVAAVRSGRLIVPACCDDRTAGAFFETGDPPPGAAGILKTRDGGACVFFEAESGRRCALQRQLGHDALPSACQQFPRATLVDERGAHVTLSHYCPTVANLLFREPGAAPAVTRLSDDAPERRRPEGFDARETVPPFLRPGVAFDMASFAAWEAGIVRWLGRPHGDPDSALCGIANAAEELRGWSPARGHLERDVRCAIADGNMAVQRRACQNDSETVAGLFAAVAASVPPGLARPSCPAGFASLDRRLVTPSWSRLAAPVGRFLAAKAFAAQTAYLGDGVRTQVMAIAAARAVLRVEMARHAAAAENAPGGPVLIDAVRSTDALIEHLSDRPMLVRSWAGVERLSRDAFLAGVGVRNTR